MDTFLQEFPKYGLSGLVILGLVLAVRALWLKYDEVQNARIVEGLKALEIIKGNTVSLDLNTQKLDSLIRAQQQPKGGNS